MSVVSMFEKASRACLNRRKFVIIPLTHPTPQEWCVRIGCRILQAHETTKYLGCLIGFQVKPGQEAEFLLDKVRKCLNHWAHQSLSFVGMVILLRHVIRAMPIYHFLLMSLNPRSYKRLEVVCRNFMWGTSTGGEFKKALVVWRNIMVAKAKGGLGFQPFQQ